MNPSEFTQPTVLPLMSRTNNNDAAVEYTIPAQDRDGGISGSSGSTPAVNDRSPTSSTPPPPTAAVVRRKATYRQKVERRGHTKSRQGCYNCKKRRIKCQETHPACEHCVKSGLTCKYPATTQIVHQPSNQIPLFSLQDMRLFQHFLLSCTPHHPLGNDSIWTHEIPCLSQNYEFLMHAILGLAASNLIAEDPSLLTFALTHRLKAIKAIKKALDDVSSTNTFEEGNALLATCYALTFQSVALDDGMAEFLTFSRGITMIADHINYKGTKCIFQNILGEDQLSAIQPLLDITPPIPEEWVDMAVKGVAGLEPLCKDEMEIKYHALITDVMGALRGPVVQAYRILFSHYGWWMEMSHEQFQSIVDPKSQVFLLLATHWITMKQIMATITEGDIRANSTLLANRKEHDMDMGMYRWLKYINRHIDAEHEQYNWWPLWVEAQIDRDEWYFRRRDC